MKDQHEKIKGYRDLSQKEIDLMNQLKDKGKEVGDLLAELHEMRMAQLQTLNEGFDAVDGLNRAKLTESFRCMEQGANFVQTGMMWSIRAVALPDSFC